MVHEKAKSGDPDFDDKQPIDQHAGKVVTAGDGREVRVSEATGPVDPTGAHASLGDPAGDATDNRPAPGDVATEPSEVQTYDAGDVPGGNAPRPAPRKSAAKTESKSN